MTFAVEGDGPEGRAEATYTILRWDDVVQGHFPRTSLKRLVATPLLWARLIRSGYVAALRQAGPRFATIIIGVHLLFAGVVAGAVLAAAGLLLAVEWEATPAIVPILAGLVLSLALLALAMVVTRGKPFYIAHLVDDAAFTHAHAAAESPEMGRRLDAFAEAILDASRDGTSDEILVVGHSSGSFLATEVLARALNRQPDLGRSGPPILLLTLGNVMPWITLDPAAERQRAALAVTARSAIGWADVIAPWDWLSIPSRDPLAVSGLPSVPGKPFSVAVALEALIDPRTQSRTRYNLFMRHFQLLMASRRTEGFDYAALIASPLPAMTFLEACRDPAEEAYVGDDPARAPLRPLPPRRERR